MTSCETLLDATSLKQELLNLDLKHDTALESSSPEDAIYFSKIAVLEFCAWIEEYQDAILESAFLDKLNSKASREDLKKAIKRNHGFHYERNFRPLIVKSIGLIKLEEFERALDQDASLSILNGVFSQVRSARNHAAHTRQVKSTYQYDAPMKIVDYLDKVEPILKKINIEAHNIL